MTYAIALFVVILGVVVLFAVTKAAMEPDRTLTLDFLWTWLKSFFISRFRPRKRYMNFPQSEMDKARRMLNR